MAAMVSDSLEGSTHANLPSLRLPVPVHRRGRGALVPKPGRAPRGGRARRDLPDAAAMGTKRAWAGRGRRGAGGRATHGPVYGFRPAPHSAAARVRVRGSV